MITIIYILVEFIQYIETWASTNVIDLYTLKAPGFRMICGTGQPCQRYYE